MARKRPSRERDLQVGHLVAAPGTLVRGALPVARLPTQGMLELPLALINGAGQGPRVWVSAAVHGDEINGVEIVRELIEQTDPQQLTGDLILIPVVNVFGFVTQSRYMPDRRDLNRSFPGSPRGSLAARLAHMFMTEVVDGCDLGIDLHTAADGRTNLPQIRCDITTARLRKLAKAFGAPAIVGTKPIDGTLRRAAAESGVDVLLYESGEAHRFGEVDISAGLEGIKRVMQTLGMYEWGLSPAAKPAVVHESTNWIRAPRSGLFRPRLCIGDTVKRGDSIGVVSDPLGELEIDVRSRRAGMVIGCSVAPLVYQGDALLHVAHAPKKATKRATSKKSKKKAKKKSKRTGRAGT